MNQQYRIVHLSGFVLVSLIAALVSSCCELDPVLWSFTVQGQLIDAQTGNALERPMVGLRLFRGGRPVDSGSALELRATNATFSLTMDDQRIDYRPSDCFWDPADSGLCPEPDQVELIVQQDGSGLYDCRETFMFDIADEIWIVEDECHSVLIIKNPIVVEPCE